MQNDIDQGKVNPGKFFVLKFDFSQINSSPDLTDANEKLISSLNCSVEKFYRTYAAYLGGNLAALCQSIDCKDPNVSVRRCIDSVQYAIDNDKQFADIEGVYMLVDEYDAFPNNYLPKLISAEGQNIVWEETAPGRTFKSFWTTIKSLGNTITRAFITGISPLSIANIGSAYNVSDNVSFDPELAGLCGLNNVDLQDALKNVCRDGLDNDAPKNICDGFNLDDFNLDDLDFDDDIDLDDDLDHVAPKNVCRDGLNRNKFLQEMTLCFNGYHFCMEKAVETVYNTQTCLVYLQRRMDGREPETRDPPNSDVSEEFLRIFAASGTAITDFEMAIQRDESGHFIPLKYSQFGTEFVLQNLVCKYLSPSSHLY